jgi:hypothetical protein
MYRRYIIRLFVVVFLSQFIFSCQNSGKSSSSTGVKTDLLKYGVPYTITAPTDVEISKIGRGELTDVSIKNKEGYDLQIFMVAAFTSDVEKLKTEKKINITSNPSFSKIVEEYDDGFLYEKLTDDGKRTYDFSVIKLVGANEINFQCGNSKEFTESEVKAMVQSIRN